MQSIMRLSLLSNIFKYILFAVLISLCSISACSNSNLRNKSVASSKINYRNKMRNFINDISVFAKKQKPNFIIIPQNGHELITKNGSATDKIMAYYLNSIDGLAREDLYYGYKEPNKKTPKSVTTELNKMLKIAKQYNKKILVTDYCYSISKIKNSYEKNNFNKYISFAAPGLELNRIPAYPVPIFNENSNTIKNLANAKNFLYLINPNKFKSLHAMNDAISKTNYDVLVIDAFYHKKSIKINKLLQFKKNGARRLVLAYMSIGEAEDYRYYWQRKWKYRKPVWLCNENKNWPGNYKVRYWHKEWKNIIIRDKNSYLNRIINAGFDGVYLDIIDAFYYFERKLRKG